MFTNDFDFQKDLSAHHVYTAWQFIQYTHKNIAIAEYCANTIQKVIEKMAEKTVRWEQDLFSNFVEEVSSDGKKIRKLTVTTENTPVYELRVAGEKVDPWFLFDKLLRDFFQYAMNSLDSISQIANAGLLANNGKKVDSVDFQRMTFCFAQATYSTAFPKTAAWFDSVSKSPEFQYIEAINNRTKHTADISNKLSMGILGSSNTAKIGPFFRKDVQHGKQEVYDQLQATLDFVKNSWDSFLTVFCDEYVLDVYTGNRYNNISGVQQQKMKNDPSQDYSYAYITAADFNAMPDEIRVLLISETPEDIASHCCPFTQILIRDVDEKTILGRYIADEEVGDDCLLHYRKYRKDSDTAGAACLYYIMQEPTMFYHNNRFFTITAVSDDDEFLGRVTLPI